MCARRRRFSYARGPSLGLQTATVPSSRYISAPSWQRTAPEAAVATRTYPSTANLSGPSLSTPERNRDSAAGNSERGTRRAATHPAAKTGRRLSALIRSTRLDEPLRAAASEASRRLSTRPSATQRCPSDRPRAALSPAGAMRRRSGRSWRVSNPEPGICLHASLPIFSGEGAPDRRQPCARARGAGW